MGFKSIISRGLPDPAEVEHRGLSEQILASPLLLPIRLFWTTLLDFRAWWPVLLPALLLLGIRVYRRERQEYLFEIALREAQQDVADNTKRT